MVKIPPKDDINITSPSPMLLRFNKYVINDTINPNNIPISACFEFINNKNTDIKSPKLYLIGKVKVFLSVINKIVNNIPNNTVRQISNFNF